ncbi:FxLD family lanthipeptide [Actinophytocola sediminis]
MILALTQPAVEVDEFALDVRVIEDSLPLAKLSCATDDNCGGSTCGSACTSNVTEPL